MQLIERNGITVAKNCMCVIRKAAKAQLAMVPPMFNRPRLSRIQPRSDLHPNQATALTFIRANPNESYLLIGKNGTGKSHIAWALYRNAVSQRHPVVACTVRDLLADFRRVEVGVGPDETLKSPRVTAEDLRRPGKPWFLFFDEFEKARPSEFAAEQLFNLLDAARSFQHQIIATSNLRIEALRAHWGRVDPIWGNSIMTRLQDCNQVDFF